MEIYLLALGLLFVLVNSAFDVSGMLIHALGREEGLSGRSLIWQRELSAPINPLLGAGYYSFWLDPGRVDLVSEDFYYKLNEAHNGYIETYLNEGLIGVFLLAALLIFALRQIKRAMLNEEGVYPALRLAILVIGLFYNYTESAFDRTNPVWFAMLVAMVGRLPCWRVGQENGSDWLLKQATQKSLRAAQVPGASG